jgi:RNA polymerase sigma-70 factor (ECF subfamily)
MPADNHALPPNPDETIDHLVHRYYTEMRRLACYILGDSEDGDDATQEAFLAAYKALPDFRGESSQRTWLTTITVNTCRTHLRRRQVRARVQDALQRLHLAPTVLNSVEEIAAQQEHKRTLWSLVDRLNEKQRIPVILRYIHDLDVPEIAAILGVPEGTVHSRLHHARKNLQALLIQHAPTSPEVPNA